MISFTCKCGQPMSVKPEFAGRQGTCPRCKQPFTVPQPGQGPAAGGHTQQFTPSKPISTAGLAPPSAGGSGPRLDVVHGPAGFQGKTVSLVQGRATVIGRDPGADLTVPSDRVSRRHCQLEPSPSGGFVLHDLGSSNGTLVNQVRIQGPTLLRGGEYIQAGDCLFRFSQ